MKFACSKEEKILLILEYRKNECLWKPNREKLYNKTVKIECLHRISEYLSIPGYI